MRSHSVAGWTLLSFAAAGLVTVTACQDGRNVDREGVGAAGRASSESAQHGPQFDRELESRAVAQAIDGTVEWAKTKDFERLYGIIADDSAYLEVHPEDEVVRGIAEFRRMENFWANPDFRSIRHEIRDLQISFSRSGDVAWFFCMLDDINEWKGQPASWINTRWTGVLEKRKGSWRMVQMHFSNPVKE